MAENTSRSGNGAIVAIVAIVAILAVLFLLFQSGVFGGGGGGGTDIDVDVDPGGAIESVTPDAD